MEFHEQAAIDYIRAHVAAEALAGVDDDEILNVIDIIFDYYEDHGLLDIDINDDDDDLDVADLTKYVAKMIAKDKQSPIKADAVAPVVEAYLEYEESVDEF